MVSLHPSNPKHNMAKPVPDVRGFVKRRIGLGRQRPSQQRQLSRQLGVLHHGIWTFARGINIHCVASPQSRCFAWFSFRSSVTNLAVQLLQYQPNSRWNIVKIALQIYHDWLDATQCIAFLMERNIHSRCLPCASVFLMGNCQLLNGGVSYRMFTHVEAHSLYIY